MKVEKGNPGYIQYRKKIDLIWLLGFIVLGIAIFLTGYFITHTRANIFTVLAVLMVLPGAKRIVALFVMIPRKSVSGERYDKVKKECTGGILYTDYVFTSTEKIMHLDFLYVKSNTVLAVVAPSKQDEEYMKKYLKDSVHKISSEYKVKVLKKDEEMIRSLRQLSQAEDIEPKETLIDFLRASMV